MIMAENVDKKKTGKGMDIFSECLAAMMYSDEEIREAMSPDDADEFIELRNNLVAPGSSREVSIGGYGDSDDSELSLAAEQEETYE